MTEQTNLSASQPPAQQAPAPQPQAAPEPQAPSGEQTQAPQVPQKFQNADGSLNHAALVESYNQLQQQFTQVSQGAATPQQQPGPATGAPPQQVQNPVDPSGLKPFLAEVRQYQQLSPQSKQLIAERFSVPQEMAEALVQGQIAQEQNYATSVLANAGLDATSYQELISYAQNALTPAQIAAYDDAVQSGDPARAMIAIQGLQSQRILAEQGAIPNQLMGRPAAHTAPDVYASTQEMMKDQGDPRYGVDKGFTQTVNQKIMRTPGEQLGLDIHVVDAGRN